MSEKYYYLVASLPTLKFGEKPAMTVDELISECARWMSPGEMAVLRSLKDPRVEESEKYPIVAEWARFDRGLRSALAEARSAAKKGGAFKASEDAKAILAAENPLEAEKTLERIRWDFIDDKTLHYNFDANWVILYLVKLKIAERLSKFDKEKGEEMFYKACEVKHEQVVGKDNVG